MTALYEQFRPRCWGEVVGQDRAVSLFSNLAKRGGIGGRAYWIVGGSGRGKTTIARLAALEIADPFNVTEIDAIDLDLDACREADRLMHAYGLGKKNGRVWIVNESHRLSAKVVAKLKTLLEPEGGIPEHVAWFFTTTNEDQEYLFEGGETAKPLTDRMTTVKLSDRDLCKPFARRLQEILSASGLDGHWEPARYERIVKDSGNSMRKAIEIGERMALEEA